MTAEPLRILVVDDSALFRTIIRNALRDIEGVSVVGNAADGPEAIRLATELEPNVITLDVEMPGMNGIEVLTELKSRNFGGHVVMVSRHTSKGAAVTTEALLEGALGFILKPSGSDITANHELLVSELKTILRTVREASADETGQQSAPVAAAEASSTGACELVLIGSSTGGPLALRSILPALPAAFPAPILIVQHMPAKYTTSLARRLNELCELEVVEGETGTKICPGRVVIAPGGRHMGIALADKIPVVELSDAPPENSCRPSVDYLFRSAFEVLPQKRMLAVILTGMGRDGTEGCALLKDCGATTIAQHAEGCTVFGMPKSVIESGLADQTVRLKHIARAISATVDGV